MRSRRLLLRVLIAGLAVALAGCGWHLRGSGPDGRSLEGVPVVVETRVGEGELVREVRRALRAAGADVRDSGSGARLVLESEDRDRQTLTVATSGSDIEERELRYRVRWRLDDAEGERVAGPETFEQFRTYRHDSGQVLGSEGQEDVLVGELRRETAFLLVDRVAAGVGE